MVEVWRARTALGPREESSACLMPSTFMLGPPPSDRTLMSTRYKPLQGSTTVDELWGLLQHYLKRHFQCDIFPLRYDLKNPSTSLDAE